MYSWDFFSASQARRMRTEPWVSSIPRELSLGSEKCLAGGGATTFIAVPHQFYPLGTALGQQRAEPQLGLFCIFDRISRGLFTRLPTRGLLGNSEVVQV